MPQSIVYFNVLASQAFQHPYKINMSFIYISVCTFCRKLATFSFSEFNGSNCVKFRKHIMLDKFVLINFILIVGDTRGRMSKIAPKFLDFLTSSYKIYVPNGSLSEFFQV